MLRHITFTVFITTSMNTNNAGQEYYQAFVLYDRLMFQESSSHILGKVNVIRCS